MQTTNEKIKKITERAINAGYNWKPTEDGKNCFYLTVCDPLFWQSLGKACGWSEDCTSCGGNGGGDGYEHNCSHCNGGGKVASNPIGVALKFHELNLTSGWSQAVDYLFNLINK